MIQRKCRTCNKTYETFPSVNKVYCSQACYTKTGADNPKWKGGQFVLSGYRYLYRPAHPSAIKMGYVAEHRLVMERKLGRYLLLNEVVHHKDGDKLNNKIRNLVICISNAEHAAEHNKTRQRDSKGRFIS